MVRRDKEAGMCNTGEGSVDQVGRGGMTVQRAEVKPPVPSFPRSFQFLETNAIILIK